MPDIIMYLTKNDLELIRIWINSEEDVAWIIKEKQKGSTYYWKAVNQVCTLLEQDYAIWHKKSGILVLPSGPINQHDIIIQDPFKGWKQELIYENHTTPWIGSHFPGPYIFSCRTIGKESSPSIARSDLFWNMNSYKSVGKPAPDVCVKWWNRLLRFIKKNSTEIPWPYPKVVGKKKAFAFPDAYKKIKKGMSVDNNPVWTYQ
jgi:hypothetical protein